MIDLRQKQTKLDVKAETNRIIRNCDLCGQPIGIGFQMWVVKDGKGIEFQHATSCSRKLAASRLSGQGNGTI